jgi:hypothetical protein
LGLIAPRLTSINALKPGLGHTVTMSSPATSPRFSAIAERLLAHARLCEEIAQECRNQETARKLRRLARECTQTAAEIESSGSSGITVQH